MACLDAGKHVLCEKMMAWDVEGCERMRQAARRTGRVLEIGYQRFYNPMYQAAYEGIIKAGTLGDVYTARIAWHRNGNWRRAGDPPTPAYDPSPWGYKDWEHLLNWRLYKQYSRGLLAELASHQVNVVNWFFDAVPEVVHGSGGVHRWKDGREVDDHVYRDVRVPGRPHGDVLVDRVQRVRSLLRGVLRHQGDAGAEGRDRGVSVRGGRRRAADRRSRWPRPPGARCSKPPRAARPMPRAGPAAATLDRR